MLNHGLRIMGATVFQLAGLSCWGYCGWKAYRRFKKISLIKKVGYFFENAGLINKKGDKPKLIKYENNLMQYTIPPGKKFSDFEKQKEGLEHVFKKEINMWCEQNRLFIREKQNIPKLVEMEEIPELKELEIPIGMSGNEFITHDLKKHVAHFLISGTTRYGKSNFLNVVVRSVKGATFNLVDLKDGVEFNKYKNEANVITTKEETKLLFKFLWKEKERRMKSLIEEGKKKYTKDFIITIIDEFAVLDDNDMLIKLLQQGAAAGIIFFVATQYPRYDIVDKLITINCDARIAFHMKDSSASRVVLNNDLASSNLAIPGRAIYQFGDDVEVQVPYAR